MIELADKVQKYSFLVVQELNKFIKHGLFNAADALKTITQSHLVSMMPNAGTSSGKHGYNVALREGVTEHLHAKEVPMFVRVNVVGNRKFNDGTWRLTFFEGGTVVNGKQRIKPLNFFEQSIASASGAIDSSISNMLSQLEQKINSIEV